MRSGEASATATRCSTLRILCEAFQIEAEGVDVRCERRLIEEAPRLNATGKMLAPVIDDAHLIDVGALRKIRLLSRIFRRTTARC